jgi:hypothetical protein
MRVTVRFTTLLTQVADMYNSQDLIKNQAAKVGAADEDDDGFY